MIERTGIGYQLWCYYERADEWKMEGFFPSPEKADDHLKCLRDDVETPCMPDWYIVEVKVVVN